MSSVGEIIATVLWLYFVVLLARFVIDLIQMLSRTWQPSGFMLVVAEFVFTLTDPPLKLLRRLIPPLKIGSITLDLSFIVLIIAFQIAIQLALSI
ncbi:MAG: YggT family protein [Candidatus Nanopelagicales bacterium]